MAYRLHPDRPLADEIRRVLGEQIDQAVAELSDAPRDPPVAVHAARKRFKKIRAVLRLVRDDLGEICRRENAFYRDLAGDLRELRDADALLERVAALTEGVGRLRSSQGVRKLLDQLEARRAAVLARHGDLAERAAAIIARLHEARERMERWTAGPFHRSTLRCGFKRIYRRGRRAMSAALPALELTAAHEWRKAVKDHWYHTRLLLAARPKVMRRRRRWLRDLGEALGEYRDLALLLQAMDDQAPQLGSLPTLRRLRSLAEHRQADLAAVSRRLGRRIYAPRPSAVGELVRRFEKEGVREE